MHVELDLGDGPQRYRRELNTMPQWAGSCWYYLRYLDPTNEDALVDPAAERYWMAATARPRRRRPLRRRRRARGAAPALRALLAQGAVRPRPRVARPSRSTGSSTRATSRAAAYTDERGVVRRGRRGRRARRPFFHDGAEVVRHDGKMGKSLKNAVTPDDIYRDYGADTLRLYEMFMGPLDASRPWNTQRHHRRAPLPAAALAQRDRRGHRRAARRPTRRPTTRPAGCCTAPSPRSATTWRRSRSTPRSPRSSS